MANDENKFLPIFQILDIKNVSFLLKLEMALKTTIRMKFELVWNLVQPTKELMPIYMAKLFLAESVGIDEVLLSKYNFQLMLRLDYQVWTVKGYIAYIYFARSHHTTILCKVIICKSCSANVSRALRGVYRFSLLWGNPVIFTDYGDIL